MRVIRIAEVDPVLMPTVTPIEGWSGGETHRTRQDVIPEGASEHFSASVVNFEKGATTGWHAHGSDQILVITAGVGIVANEQEQHEVTVGDVVQVMEGERHWHGAKKESYMSHITITRSGSRSSR
jgi:quercetin dioxygenase-like cupin family protein